jgi:hypothetical protein
MNNELRDKLKSQRLEDYQAQMFILQMDITALEAIGDAEKVEICKSTLDMMQKSYKAVEAL